MRVVRSTTVAAALLSFVAAAACGGKKPPVARQVADVYLSLKQRLYRWCCQRDVAKDHRLINLDQRDGNLPGRSARPLVRRYLHSQTFTV